MGFRIAAKTKPGYRSVISRQTAEDRAAQKKTAAIFTRACRPSFVSE
ncbi:hypothetical protein BAMTA208_18735 [Bacillus amyloliquefaciens TA208]|nr:hypothetical protein BAMTA208_18735 [Bacillus amyloliquefaciens TA208]